VVLKGVNNMKVLGALVWVAGFILAKGFWLSLLAFVCPFYAYYLVVYKLMVMGGVVT
jgi:hypothetical protein